MAVETAGLQPQPPELQDEVSSLCLLGLVWAAPIIVGPSGAGLASEMDQLAASLAASHAGMAPGQIPGLAPARKLYRAFGVDPTRTRPSSEALLRRILLGKPLPRILNAVDLCNLCSLLFLLPIGLYDAARIRGRVMLRRGTPGESFKGIRKDEVHLEGRPTLADQEGPFGNPSSDSLRTSVDESTTSLWMVIFAPADTSPGELAAHVEVARDGMTRHLGPPGTVHSAGRDWP